jgi:ribosomal-protein-alanine N-acetyltransferase
LQVIECERLRLRPFTLADAPDVARLAGDALVAETTLNIPHPYPPGAAEAWIGAHRAEWERGTALNLALERREDGVLLGAIGLGINADHASAEVGYWIGVPYWGSGYATEAARALIAYAFDELGLNRLYAYHVTGNPASGRVMQKAGMRLEGELRQNLRKGGEFRDSRLYAVIRSDR